MSQHIMLTPFLLRLNTRPTILMQYRRRNNLLWNYLGLCWSLHALRCLRDQLP